MSEEQHGTYELYDTPYARYLQKEIELATAIEKEVYEPSDFSAFDTMHYCGDNYIKSKLETLRN